jgi:hypothetical protein
MPGKMRESSAAKAEAPGKIDDDQAEQPFYVGRGATAEARGPCLPPHRSRSSSVTNVCEVRSACGAGILLIGGRHLRLADVVTS